MAAVRGSRVAGPSLGRHTIVACNVCYVDVWSMWHVFHVVSGIRTTTVSNAWPHVDRYGLSISCMRAKHDLLRASTARPLACNTEITVCPCIWTTIRFCRSGTTLSSLLRASGVRSLRASEAISSCERGAISCVRARLDLVCANVEDGSFGRHITSRCLNDCCVDVRTLPCRQRVDGRGSRVGCLLVNG